MNWVEAITRLHRDNTAFVIVTVLATRGSAPRGALSKIVVTASTQYDSIGGGQLEFGAIRHARTLLDTNESGLERIEYTLGKDLTQCCGGEIELLYEHFAACRFHIALYGAGHVGQALVRILSDCACRIRWIDSREALLQSAMAACHHPANVTPEVMENPFASAENTPAGCYHLIMTHSHEIDFELCEAILGNDDTVFCGLIGSKSKAASFAGRLKRKGFTDDEISKLTSPVGLALGNVKQPMEVAVAVAAQLLQLQAAGASPVG